MARPSLLFSTSTGLAYRSSNRQRPSFPRLRAVRPSRLRSRALPRQVRRGFMFSVPGALLSCPGEALPPGSTALPNQSLQRTAGVAARFLAGSPAVAELGALGTGEVLPSAGPLAGGSSVARPSSSYPYPLAGRLVLPAGSARHSPGCGSLFLHGFAVAPFFPGSRVAAGIPCPPRFLSCLGGRFARSLHRCLTSRCSERRV